MDWPFGQASSNLFNLFLKHHQARSTSSAQSYRHFTSLSTLALPFTMQKYATLLATLLFAVFSGVEGFSAPWTTTASTKRRIASSTQRNAILIREKNDESTYRFLLAKARECAFSDFATVQEAKRHLTQILELESGCVSGNLAGRDICDNVDELADIVAHLRQKADQHGVVRYVAYVMDC
jgi:hypothetical protein